jgi:single-strand DNA-binding protein
MILSEYKDLITESAIWQVVTLHRQIDNQNLIFNQLSIFMEKSINKVELSGFAGMDPEVKTLENGKQMIRFSLATSESYKNQKDEWVRITVWHNIVMWDATAESALDKIKKGSFVKLTGKIVSRQYTDKNGVKQTAFQVRAFMFEVVELERKLATAEAA